MSSDPIINPINDHAIIGPRRKTKELPADLEYEQFRRELVDELYADSREQPVRKVRKGRRS